MEPLCVTGAFQKLNPERRLAFGWAYVTKEADTVVVDHSGDFVDDVAEVDFEDAAYDYVLKSREGDEMHVRFTGVAKVVESFVLTKEKAQAMGIETDRYGWWVGLYVEDEAVWAKVKNGTYPAFSIRGSGEREPVDA